MGVGRGRGKEEGGDWEGKEVEGGVGGGLRCGNCQRTGHNSRTCTREAWMEGLQSYGEAEEEVKKEVVEKGTEDDKQEEESRAKRRRA